MVEAVADKGYNSSEENISFRTVWGDLVEFRDFMRCYCIYPILSLWNLENQERAKFLDELLSHTKFFFYQDRKLESHRNYYLSMEFLQEKLLSDCKTFCILNFVSLGMGVNE